jgi:hypothetical protein
MPARVAVYQEVFEQVERITRPVGLRRTAVQRLALLVTGIIAAKSTVLAQVAAALFALDLTTAGQAESIGRRLRRTRSEERLAVEPCYLPVLAEAIDWEAVRRGSKRVVLIVDESSKADDLHLFRVSLAYWGGSLPLAWSVWEPHVAMAAGRYRQAVDRVFSQVATVLPAGLAVVMVADRADDVPAFIDRVAARGWHWAVRVKATGTLRFLDHQGHPHALADLVRQRLRQGGRWQARGRVFPAAGGRDASVVGLWTPTAKDALVVLSDLPCRWNVLCPYGHRFWIEPGFRNDKSRGWRWEDSQVRGVGHHHRLLLAMAWAALVTRCLGVQHAKNRLAALATRPATDQPPKPQHPRECLFTLGLRAAQCWLAHKFHRSMHWPLPDIDARSWHRQGLQAQADFFLFGTVRP